MTEQMTMPMLVAELKQNQQDHEFYPTTNEIIAAVIKDLKRLAKDGNYYLHHGYESLLDIGAGNGKVLMALKDIHGDCHFRHLYAIEKSPILCRQLPEEVMVIGTNFNEQSLCSKQVDVIFCNPPYSEFELWTRKIIREAFCEHLYLVIPVRWENCTAIADALKFRHAKAIKVGQFHFNDAEDRQARANVHLLRVDLDAKRGSNQDADGVHSSDPFDLMFDEQFKDLIAKFENASKPARKPGDDDNGEDDTEKSSKPYASLVVGANYPDALVNIYNHEMDKVNRNYEAVNALDVELMKEFDVSPKRIKACLRAKLDGLRNEYWNELFSNLSAITDRLTSNSRKLMLEGLSRHVTVDFTVSNIYEVVIWAIKNANKYIDSQLLATYREMVEKANVHLYKSNQRTFRDDQWRHVCYERDRSDLPTHFMLDYRIVTHRLGGMRPQWQFDKPTLTETAADFMGDLLTIARNLGFTCETNDRRLTYHGRKYDGMWEPGKPQVFDCINNKRREILFEAKAFINGNVHFRFNQDFILALNVEFGRLSGWLRSGKQAAEELNEPKAEQYFSGNLQICADKMPMMIGYESK